MSMSSSICRMITGFHSTISAIDFNSKVVVDLGCGFERWGHLIRSEVDKGGNNAYIMGCDVYRPYLEETRKYNPYDDLVVCDVKNLPFKEKSFDITFALEIIEHMTKPEGMKFLSKLENWTSDTVIISTPYGYYPQGEAHNNLFEIHRSVWHPEDFLECGYQTFKCGVGAALEKIISKLKIFGLTQFFFNLARVLLDDKHVDQWSGIMIFAVKKLM